MGSVLVRTLDTDDAAIRLYRLSLPGLSTWFSAMVDYRDGRRDSVDVASLTVSAKEVLELAERNRQQGAWA